MRKLITASCSILALAAIPLAAQAQDAAAAVQAETPAASVGLQLTAEQQTQYEAWPTETKAYYGTLDAPKQEAFWMLTAEQRTQVQGLPAEQQGQVWTSILAQVDAARTGAPVPAPAAPPVTPPESVEPAVPAPAEPVMPAEPAAPLPDVPNTSPLPDEATGEITGEAAVEAPL